MDKLMFQRFCAARNQFKTVCEEIEARLPGLARVQQLLVEERQGPLYSVETPVVYNTALDDVGEDAQLALILVADNPGRREQAKAMRRYLVGPSGKIAERFFRESLALDFRRHVLILNKTPVHTPRTVELRELVLRGGEELRQALSDSQRKMADLLRAFYEALKIPIWIIGYSEMKKNGVFADYTAEVQSLLDRELIAGSDLLLYRHFSMNQFTIDLKNRRLPDETTQQALARIGSEYRRRVFK